LQRFTKKGIKQHGQILDRKKSVLKNKL